MIERLDPNSGAILFKKDEEIVVLEKALKKALEKIDNLEKRVAALEAESLDDKK